MLRPVSNTNQPIIEESDFKTISVIQFASLDEANWIIDDILPQGELAVIFGEPGCGKTFLALDMAMSVARGIQWHHKDTSQGRVVYICAEGTHGFKKRTYAYLKAHNIFTDINLPFDVIADSPDFLADFDSKIIAQSVGKASVIIIDTFSRVMAGGNENSGEDMGHAIQQCKILHQLTGAIIILIHHSGKDAAKGARGWSGLLGACDTEIEVVKLSNGHRAKLTKQKDGEDGLEWGFKLNVIELGETKKGKLITSCVYEPLDSIPLGDKKTKKEEELAPSLQSVFDAFKAFQSQFVPEEELINYLVKQRSYDKTEGKRDTRAQLVVRALNSLYERKVLKIIGDTISLY